MPSSLWLFPLWLFPPSCLSPLTAQVLCSLTLTSIYTLSSVQFSPVRLFVTPWTVARQASLSITNSQSYDNSQTHAHRVSDAIQPSHPVVPVSSCPQSLPASASFPVSLFIASGGQSIGVSASASVLPMNIQDWFPLGLTAWISLQSKGLSKVFSTGIR